MIPSFAKDVSRTFRFLPARGSENRSEHWKSHDQSTSVISHFVRLAFVGVLFLQLCVFMCASLAQSVDQPAPDFRAPSLDGKQVSLQEFTGQLVYLDFWASWCVPCRVTLPWMQEMQDRYSSRGLKVITINLDKNRESARALVEKLAPGLTVVLDDEGKIASTYSLPSMPTSYLIDRNRRIVHVQSGFREGDGDELEHLIQEQLRLESPKDGE